jgi:hypothetical protein
MTTVSPINFASTAPEIQKTRAVSRTTRGANPVVLDTRAVNADARKKREARRPAKHADGAFKPTNAQTTSSSDVLAALNNLTLGG